MLSTLWVNRDPGKFHVGGWAYGKEPTRQDFISHGTSTSETERFSVSGILQSAGGAMASLHGFACFVLHLANSTKVLHVAVADLAKNAW